MTGPAQLTDKKPLAQRALQVYDQEGERAMLEFLAENRAEPPSGEKDYPRPANKQETRFYLLADGTIVQHSPRPANRQDGNLHIFSWAGKQDGRSVHETQTRPAALGPEEYSSLPAYLYSPRRVHAMLDWPNSESVRNAVTERAEEEARRRLGEEAGYETLLDQQDSLAHTPGLDPALREVFGEYDLPEHLLVQLDAEQQLLAGQAIERLPAGQFEQLVQAAARKLRENG